MKQGKLIRRAVSAALTGCMMFTLSAPALAESTDALMQLNISGNRAVSVLDAENGYGITVNGKEVTDENKDDILAGTSNAGKLKYETGVLRTDNTRLNGTLRINAPNTDIKLNGGQNIAAGGITSITAANNVTITSDEFSAIWGETDIECDGVLKISGGQWAVHNSLTVKKASAVEIEGEYPGSVIYGSADITCNGPVTIRNKDSSGKVANNGFTYNRTDGADYVYFTSEDAETEAIDGSITPIPSDAPYSYLHIEEKTFSAITVNNGIAKAGGSEVQMAFNGQKVTVIAQIDETDERKFDGWEVVNAPAGFTISAEKLAQREFSFIMPTGNVELTAHHSNKLEVSGGTAKVNGNSNADFARPGAAVTVTAGSPEDYQFDHWEVSGGNIGKTEEELKVSPLSFTMPDAAVKLTAVYKAKDFGVDTPQPKPEPEEPEEPEAPAESAAGAIAAVAIGGAAVWGGYEITTRAILKNLLPADAAIPKTQGQLAELLWQNAGCPQPTVAQATDAAAAARWCVEQGYLEEDFAPEKYVPKYKVIRILKQAKSVT